MEYPYEILKFYSVFFKTTRWNYQHDLLINNFCICGALFNHIFLEKRYLHRSFYGPKKNKKVQKFSSFPVHQTFCSLKPLTAFRPLEYQSTISLPLKGSLNTWLPHDAIDSSQREPERWSSPKLKFGRLRLDIKIRFPSQQLSRFLPSRSQSTLVFLYTINQYPHLLSILPWKFL